MTHVLFVDDDQALLETLSLLMSELSGNTWQVHTAADSAQALALLQNQPMNLMVVDIHMPTVDGLQFLKLVHRKYPSITKVVLTGDSSGAYRDACLNSGAELFLEKPRSQGGWPGIYATLNELARLQPEEGFQGVLRRAGLQDILQMECLSRNSSLLQITGSLGSGTIYIKDGQIVHAEMGKQTGEKAFNQLLALTGGQFHLQPFADPPVRTIESPWEHLLMEAARQRDEASQSAETPLPPLQSQESLSSAILEELAAAKTVLAPVQPCGSPLDSEPREAMRPNIDEVLLCTHRGEVLYQWPSSESSGRVQFLNELALCTEQLGRILPLGRFDRLIMQDPPRRAVAQLQLGRRLLVKSSQVAFAHLAPSASHETNS